MSISVSGCVSRSVRDTAAWLSVTEQSGADAAFAPVGMVSAPSTQRLRILVTIPDALGREPDPEVRAATEAAAELCRGLGHHVSEGRPAINGEQFTDDFILLWAASAAEVVALVTAAAPGAPLDQLLEPLTLGLAEHFRAKGGERALGAAVARLHQVEAQYAEIFAGVDVLLTPVLAKPPLPLGEITPSLGMDGFARVVEYASYTPLQNVAGAPGMSVPLSWSAAGLPIGAHFAAAKGQEKRLLELAYELEQAQPWAGRVPAIHAG